jgi:hypothetical protein
MKIGAILVFVAINFISLSLQNDLDYIENVDEVEEPKTFDGVPIHKEPKAFDGVPINKEIPFNKKTRKTSVQKLSDKDDLDVPEGDLRKQSKLTKKVHPAESKGKKVDNGSRKKTSKIVEATDGDDVIMDIDRKKVKDVKRNKKVISINKKPDDEEFSANTDVNPRNFFKKQGFSL